MSDQEMQKLRERNAAEERRINAVACAAGRNLGIQGNVGGLIAYLHDVAVDTPLRFRFHASDEELELVELYFDRRRREYIIELEFKR